MSPKLAPITTSFYGNCSCEDSQGHLIFRCSSRKMKWYLNRGLAEITSNPTTFRLLFDPKGPGHYGDPFFLQARANLCVTCGTPHDLTHHHVVPHCYRRFYPLSWNRFGPYDVMMLCENDHLLYEKYSDELKLKIAEEFNAPLNGIPKKESLDTRIIKAAFAIKEHGNKIPEPKRQELLSKLQQYFSKEKISPEDLDTICNRNTKHPVVTHGQIVVANISDIDSFNIRWRKHFKETMDPKFLPEHWDINRKFLVDKIV